ncbi:MAG: hypothetical protein V4542_10020 [Pseudomonadota bacterium]
MFQAALADIAQLLRQKRAVMEQDIVTRLPVLNAFIEMSLAELAGSELTAGQPDLALLDVCWATPCLMFPLRICAPERMICRLDFSFLTCTLKI